MPLIQCISTRFCSRQVIQRVPSARVLLNVGIELINVVFVIRYIDRIPCPGVALGVEKQTVMNAPVLLAPLFCVAVRGASLPSNLSTELVRTEDSIQYHFEVMACRRVTVQVQAPGRLQHAVQLHQPGGHHHQVGHHLVGADELAQRADHAAHVGRRIVHQVVIGLLGGVAPMPGVVKGDNLRLGIVPAFVPEQHVVGAVGVERRVEVNQVHAFGRDILAQDGQIVAIE